ncbi:MAG: YkvA family protein [Bacteroidota bacterium]
MKKLAEYRRYFSESRFWTKLKNYATAAGVKAVYSALLLYYAYKRKETPAWARRVVLGILGYFILPVDAIPDLGWLVGYTDDIGLLSMGLVMIAGHINEDVRTQAREQLAGWFPEADEAVLQSVDDKL